MKYLFYLSWALRNYLRERTKVKNENIAKKEALKRSKPIFYVRSTEELGRYCVYDFYFDRRGNLMFFIKNECGNRNIPARNYKFDGFCAEGKEELTEMLSEVRMSNDRMDELRFFCNAIGLSEKEQDEIREIIINDYI